MDRERLLDDAWVVKAADDLKNQIEAIATAFAGASKIVDELDEAADPGFVSALLKTRACVGDQELNVIRSFGRLLGKRNDLFQDETPLFAAIASPAIASSQAYDSAAAIVRGGVRLDECVVGRLESFSNRAAKTDRELFEDARSGCLESFGRKVTTLAIKSIESKVDALLKEIWQFRENFVARLDDNGFEEPEDRVRYDAAVVAIVKLARSAYRDVERHLGFVESFEVAEGDTHTEALWRAVVALQRFASGRFADGGGFSFDPERQDLHSTELADALFYLATNSAPLGSGPVELAVRPPRKLRAIELCAGGGGQAIGLMSAGFEHVALYEKLRRRVATLKRNWSSWNVRRVDIRDVPDSELAAYKEIDLLAGGPPCAPFSQAGNRLGRRHRDDLFPEMIRAVKIVGPRAFMFENVPGMKDTKHASYLARICADLSSLGYRVDVVTVDASDFGLPQDRTRIVIVGLRNDVEGLFIPPRPAPPLQGYVSDVLGPLLIRHETPDELKSSVISGSPQWKYDQWAKSWRETFARERLPTITKTSSEDRHSRLRRLAKAGFDGTSFAGGPPSLLEAQDEGFMPKLTLDVLARAQGFPDRWVFHAEGGGNIDMVGDAFPPIVAKAFGLAIYTALTGVRFDLAAALAEPLLDESRIGFRPLRGRVGRSWDTTIGMEMAERLRRGEPIEDIEPIAKRRTRIRRLASLLDAEEKGFVQPTQLSAAGLAGPSELGHFRRKVVA